MGIRLEVSTEMERVWLYQFEGSWDWNDLTQAMLQDEVLAAEKGWHDYDAIGDLSHSATLPSNGLSRLSSILNSRFQRANVKKIVIVTQNSFFLAMYTIFKRMYNSKNMSFTVAATMEEAYAQINSRRAAQTAS